MANSSKTGIGALTVARRIVQIAVAILFCVPLLIVGFGLFGSVSGTEQLDTTASMLPFFGSLSSSTIGGVVLMDPFALLETVAASKDFAVGWLIAALPVLIVYGVIRGRAFCGWVCPVNLLLEFIDWLRGKLNIKVADHALPRHTKLWVALGVLVLSALTGTLVFEAFSPISAINKGILFGSLTGIIVLAAIIIIELFWARRVWCRALCPLGGFYEALGEVGLVSVKMDARACTHCNACRHACICDPEILDGVLDKGASHVSAGDCMLCGKCVEACPAHALSIGVAAPFPKK